MKRSVHLSPMLSFLTLFAVLGSLSSCGKDEDPAGMSAAERAKYCAYFAPQEEDAAVRDAFLHSLDGKRFHKINSKHELIFEYFYGEKKLRLWDNDGLFKNYESIQAGRLCVSKPLDRQDSYQGFRLIEFEANNNEGVGAIAVKPTAGDGLLVTNHTYNRWGQGQEGEAKPAVLDLESFFYPSGSATPVTPYAR